MTGDTTIAFNMKHRAVMQYLSLSEWKRISHLPVLAGPNMIDRMHAMGWIERRGMQPRTEIRLTQSGLKAMRAAV